MCASEPWDDTQNMFRVLGAKNGRQAVLGTAPPFASQYGGRFRMTGFPTDSCKCSGRIIGTNREWYRISSFRQAVPPPAWKAIVRYPQY
jgi:hypothetical protein